MNGKGVENRRTILSLLKNHPEGLTITSIASLSKLHRHTVTKYMYELRGADMVVERVIGPAKLFYLRAGLSSDQKSNILGRLNGAMKSTASLGQVQILAVLLFLFLVPTTIIIAQNATNFSENLSVPASGWTVAANEGVTDPYTNNTSVFSNLSGEDGIIFGTNDTSNESIFTIPVLNMTVNGTNATIPSNESVNITLPDNMTIPCNQTNQTFGNETDGAIPGNGTNATEPPVNITENITEETEPPLNITLNETQENITERNITQPEENITFPEENATETNTTEEQPAPEITVLLDNPDQVTRDKEDFVIRAVITNNGGPAHDVVVEWVLPDGFAVVDGSVTEYVGVLGASETVTSEITVFPVIQTELGPAEIRARVSYE